jgi:hypothetical protein
MSDAISRSAVLPALVSHNDGYLMYCDWHDSKAECESAIRSIPALDAVTVVRCVDCKYRCTLVCPMYHTETCLDDLDGFDDYNVDRTDDDGFCHLGKRWEGEEE